MPTGLYGSPQLGPYREIHRQQSSAQRMAALITLDPIWRRIVPWRGPRVLLRSATMLGWIACGSLAAPSVAGWITSTDLPERARLTFHLDATPTVEVERSRAVVPLTAPLTTPFAATGTGAPKIALVASSCKPTGQPVIVACEGSLRNISGYKLSDLQVNVDMLATRMGEPQVTTSASIDIDPLLPGQASSWTVVGRYNPAFTWFKIRVTDRAGNEIQIQDERTPPPANGVVS